MTEPISDEALALLREEHSEQVVAALPGGDLCAADDYYVPCPTLALLARLDAAERDLLIERTANRVTENHNHFDCAAEMAKLRIERDAALARAVPDGHTRIGGDVWRVTRGPHDDGTYRLVPADTERKPTS